MHLYVKKLIDQGWLTSKYKFIGFYPNGRKKFKKKKDFLKARSKIIEYLIKITSFLPMVYSINYRISILLADLTIEQLRCPVCNNFRKRYRRGIRFALTCTKEDKEHKSYITRVSVENQQKTCLLKYKETSYTKTDEYKNKSKKPNQGHLNQANLKLLSKEYIEENFIDKNGYLLIEKLRLFGGWKRKTAAYRLCARLEVNFKKQKSNNHLNYDNMDLLNKEYIENNFINEKNHLLLRKFQRFINCKGVAIIYNLCKKFKVNYTVKKSNDHLNHQNINLLSKDYIEKNLMDKNGGILLEKFMNFTGHKISEPIFEICRNFGVYYKRRPSGNSKTEETLSNFISSLIFTTIQRNNREIIKPKELDIYLPEQKLAIEYNGIMYHSHGTNSWSAFNNPISIPDKHLNKTKACSALGIDLIHIFEDEYLNNQKVIEQLIRRKLNVEDWPEFTEEEIRWPINWGELPEQLQKDYILIKTIPPRANYFKFNYPKQVSKWTQYKTEEELYEAGYRKYYDCGELVLENITKKTKENKQKEKYE